MRQTEMFAFVQEKLNQMEVELAAAIESPNTLVTEIGRHLLSAGGKRLRPGLYFLCAGANKNMQETMPVAVALELIHMATLVHDDVLDHADVRRGEMTANARWDNKVAVLAGDYLFTRACSLVASTSDREILKILTDIISTVCEGEIFQIQDKFNPYQTEEDYLTRITQKTADFIGASCKLGGKVAGFDTATIGKLYQYGCALGMAFQITDDILDITATEGELGKPVCNDLRQGILTLPAIYALQTSTRRKELQSLILAGDMSDAALAQCMDIINETDGMNYTFRRLMHFLEVARSNIPQILPADIQEALNKVIDYIGSRKF